ncbi:MAG TPA: TetR/AcrR family transcriptional regulator [Solirubrobacteraceae bacterium]
MRGVQARRDEGAGDGILALQRARLLSAAVGLLAERGYGGVSVARISARAGISRRTYYEIFENREQCLAAVLLDAEERVLRLIARNGVADLPWRERVRCGLWVILSLADSEPALARGCLVETQRAGGLVTAERERILERLTSIVDEGRLEGGRERATGALTAEALVGAVATILATRASQAGEQSTLRELLGELMSMIVLPHLGAAAARRELGRPLPSELDDLQVHSADRDHDGVDPLAGMPARLTYRTAKVLQAVASLDGGERGPSNREIADLAEVHDHGQISKLLTRLEHYGLAKRAVVGRGEPNSWELTETGRRLVRGIGAGQGVQRSAA